MSWSYSGDPSATALDACRFAIGDTIEKSPMMQDQEIQYIIDLYSSNNDLLMYNLFLRAAVLFARDIKRSLGPQSEDPTERLKFFKEQAAIYRSKSASAGFSVPMYSYPKIFRKGMNSNPPSYGGDKYV